MHDGSFFFSFFPPSINPDPVSMNWSVAVFFGVLAIAMIHWGVHARKIYTGPIIEILDVNQLYEDDGDDGTDILESEHADEGRKTGELKMTVMRQPGESESMNEVEGLGRDSIA